METSNNETQEPPPTRSEQKPGILASIRVYIPKSMEKYALAGFAVVVAIFCAAPIRVIKVVWHVFMTSVGSAIGVGIGFGLAMHVHEHLQQWQKAHDEQKKPSGSKKKRVVTETVRPKSASRQSTNMLEDGTSYTSLMASAGYLIEDKVMRGQVLKEDDSFWKINYRFTDVTVDKQYGPRLLHEDWPSLPEPVTRELGRFVEHVMRDFIAGWYTKVDPGCIFLDEKERRDNGISRDGGKIQQKDVAICTKNRTDSEASDSATSANNTNHTDESQRKQTYKKNTSRQARKMVFSTMTHRQIPMLDHTYKTLSAAFGNLATRAEHVNIFSLALLKWTQVLAHTFRVYRTLRRVAQQKHSTETPSEVQVTREFLLAGKLHRAVTFGLDVPSLLFADATGQECGTGTEKPPLDPDQVLEQRLYGTSILGECELDYNRVVAHRLVRALIPRSDSSSHVALALVVEIFGSCVLQPLMNLWVPSFLNNIIKKATANKTADVDEGINNNIPAEPTVSQGGQEELGGGDAASTQVQPIENEKEPVANASVSISDRTIQSSQGSNPLSGVDITIEGETMRTPTFTKQLSAISVNSESAFLSEALAPDIDATDGFIDEASLTAGQVLLKLAALALVDLQKHMDFEQCRLARLKNYENGVDWDDPSCQEAVLKLVIVLEAAIFHGRAKPLISPKDTDEVGSMTMEPTSMSQILMEMTSDMDAFETIIDQMETPQTVTRSPEDKAEYYEIDAGEISTLRTLISTWFHTGQGFRALSLLVKASQTILAPFYDNHAFFRNPRYTESFLETLNVLDGLDIMVETMAALAMPRVDLEAESSLLLAAASEGLPVERGSLIVNEKEYRRGSATSLLKSGTSARSSDDHIGHSNSDPMSLFTNVSTPRYLDFHRNAAFASSLRSERERRMRSWASLKADENLQTIHRKTALPADIDLHLELHNLSRMFYNGTNVMTIRDAARKNETSGQPVTKPNGEQEKVSLLTVEMVSNRRRIEVPDDDSSFLLRAQPRPLNPVSVHRDDRNHDQSYKCFLATYEEPAIQSGSNRYTGGRYIRRCLLQYYPGDRTASIMLHNDARKLDKRKGLPLTQESPGPKSQNSTTYLPGSFLRERHLCQKWTGKGAGTQNFLSSTVMEATDFNASPRSGKALDFVYRMSLFEKPAIDLSGKRFIVQDSTGRGPHRADASSLEVSDASLSALLLTIGRDLELGEPKEESKVPGGSLDGSNRYRHKVEMGPDGYPMIFMKFSTKQGDQVSTEIKPYRLSFVRAALMVTSARQEAQLQCLIECVKAGSAKSATKARTEAQLRPTLKILEYANDKSADKSKSSSLLRDLKLGIYHIDREQLRRNGLLNPRSPTSLVALSAKVEGSVQAKDVADMISVQLPPTSNLYKIRCVALVELMNFEEEFDDMEPYTLDDGSLARQYREEWVVYRSMKDFQALHRHLKGEVAAAESSASTGSRLVGAATAAFGNNLQGRKQRKALVPSLAQASKIGAIAITKKAIARRGEMLDEYLDYLLTANQSMNRCMDLMLFLGASFPFPPEVKVMKTPTNLVDPLGRLNFIRSVSVHAPRGLNRNVTVSEARAIGSNLEKKTDTVNKFEKIDEFDESEEADGTECIENLIPSILNKVDQVQLADVRNRIVELVRYQFGFENASFFRSRLLSALQTASFVAITKASDFRRVLYDLHVQHLNPDALAGWIEMVLDILWPDGVWLVPAPPYTEQEEADLREDSRACLHGVFPDQLRVILGKDLTRDGLDVVHEMLQNRVVVKSLFYMLFDLLWIEVFPELRDVLTCATALDIE